MQRELILERTEDFINLFVEILKTDRFPEDVTNILGALGVKMRILSNLSHLNDSA